MGKTLVKIEGKMKALTLQAMGNEQRDNWADNIILQLERMSSASDISIKDIYKCMCSLVSDSCKVSKGLAAVMYCKLGLEWVPGQLYCLIHSVLGLPNGISSTWLKYKARSWNRYEEYTIFCSERVLQNMGRRCCMVTGLVSLRNGVPLLSTIYQPGKILCLPTPTSGTNAIFLRDIVHLSPMSDTGWVFF